MVHGRGSAAVAPPHAACGSAEAAWGAACLAHGLRQRWRRSGRCFRTPPGTDAHAAAIGLRMCLSQPAAAAAVERIHADQAPAAAATTTPTAAAAAVVTVLGGFVAQGAEAAAPEMLAAYRVIEVEAASAAAAAALPAAALPNVRLLQQGVTASRPCMAARKPAPAAGATATVARAAARRTCTERNPSAGNRRGAYGPRVPRCGAVLCGLRPRVPT
mmetsp:Transcript_462/g.1244  ORF Transcript_462/g.1244 Transcript_462/m.1244 type:complete len:216 (-) Transcript_462:560-1207(-)